MRRSMIYLFASVMLIPVALAGQDGISPQDGTYTFKRFPDGKNVGTGTFETESGDNTVDTNPASGGTTSYEKNGEGIYVPVGAGTNTSLCFYANPDGEPPPYFYEHKVGGMVVSTGGLWE